MHKNNTTGYNYLDMFTAIAIVIWIPIVIGLMYCNGIPQNERMRFLGTVVSYKTDIVDTDPVTHESINYRYYITYTDTNGKKMIYHTDNPCYHQINHTLDGKEILYDVTIGYKIASFVFLSILLAAITILVRLYVFLIVNEESEPNILIWYGRPWKIYLLAYKRFVSIIHRLTSRRQDS